MSFDVDRRYDDGVAVADSYECVIGMTTDCAFVCSIDAKLAACAAAPSCALQDMNSFVPSSFYPRLLYRPVYDNVANNSFPPFSLLSIETNSTKFTWKFIVAVTARIESA